MKGNYTKIRKMIWDKLGEGDMNSLQIKDYINSNHKHGITSNALCNVLSKHPEFKNIGEERTRNLLGSTYMVKIWGRN